MTQVALEACACMQDKEWNDICKAYANNGGLSILELADRCHMCSQGGELLLARIVVVALMNSTDGQELEMDARVDRLLGLVKGEIESFKNTAVGVG